jgi:hypothetical protein
VIPILVDHNMEGQAILLWGTLAAEGWLGLLPLQLVRFTDVGLPPDASDRDVWRLAQARGMLLLTVNRNMREPGSLEQTIREENAETSWPVLTIGSPHRLDEKSYREECAVRLVEIVLDVEELSRDGPDLHSVAIAGSGPTRGSRWLPTRSP